MSPVSMTFVGEIDVNFFIKMDVGVPVSAAVNTRRKSTQSSTVECKEIAKNSRSSQSSRSPIKEVSRKRGVMFTSCILKRHRKENHDTSTQEEENGDDELALKYGEDSQEKHSTEQLGRKGLVKCCTNKQQAAKVQSVPYIPPQHLLPSQLKSSQRTP